MRSSCWARSPPQRCCPAGATAEPASQPTSAEAGFLDVGNFHSCAAVASAATTPSPVRCWGYGGDGRSATRQHVHDRRRRDARRRGPVDLGAGRTAKAIAAGAVHTCALLDNGDGALLRLRRRRPARIREHRSDRQRRAARGRRPVDLGPAARQRRSPPGARTRAPCSTTATCAAGATASTAVSATAPPTASATTRLPASRARSRSARGARRGDQRRRLPHLRAPRRRRTCAAGATATNGQLGHMDAGNIGDRTSPTKSGR